MSIKKFIFLLPLFCFANTNAQISDNMGIPYEEVYMMTNKNIYETSEDLWFKAFVFDRTTMKLSDINKTLYLVIKNPDDSVVWSERYPLSLGMGNGQVYVGDDWMPGEYVLSGYTRSSVGKNDTTALFPQRITVVGELRDVPKTVKPQMRDELTYVAECDSISVKDGNLLNVSISTDTTVFHPRAMIPMRISVKDTEGNPVQSHLAISVSDALYHNPYISNNMIASLCSRKKLGGKTGRLGFNDMFLPDGVRGTEYIGNKRKARRNEVIGEQWLEVFSDGGQPIFGGTAADGGFEIEPSVMEVMEHIFYVKPLSGKEFKPGIRFESTFDSIERYVDNRRRVVFTPRHTASSINSSDENAYLGRSTTHLPDVEIVAKVRYPKRQKLMGYLDSISAMTGGAWVCGCPAGASGESFLNDYRTGYTHPPEWITDYQPRKHTKPVKGKTYEMIKYLPGGDSGRGYVADIKSIVWQGDEYTEEELLKMNNLWKATGYYKSPKFNMPDETYALSSMSDIRNTLLWMPDASTHYDGTFDVLIPASDICSRFIIDVIAVDINGKMGTAKSTFNIIN